MSRKWLEQEGPSWIEKGIISEQQLVDIKALYPEKERAIGIFPLLASILIGLGVLSFIASNWDGIPQLVRLLLILVIMTGFYLAGYRFFQRPDTEKLGLGLIGIGVMSFGGGIILLGQMFHLVTHHVGSFIIWGLAGLALTYLLRSRFLFLLSAVILNIAQIYSLENFHTFSYVSFAVLLLGLGVYWSRNRNALLSWVLSVSVVIQGAVLIGDLDWEAIWLVIPALFIYTVGDWFKDRHLQYFPLIMTYGISVIMSYVGDSYFEYGQFQTELSYLLITSLVLAILSLFGKYRQGTLRTGWEWVLFAPSALVILKLPMLYVPALLAFSLYVLLSGYHEEYRRKVNVGTVLFLLSTLVGYTRLAWDFMDKSVFFLTGGVLIFALHLFLQKRKRDVFGGEGK